MLEGQKKTISEAGKWRVGTASKYNTQERWSEFEQKNLQESYKWHQNLHCFWPKVAFTSQLSIPGYVTNYYFCIFPFHTSSCTVIITVVNMIGTIGLEDQWRKGILPILTTATFSSKPKKGNIWNLLWGIWGQSVSCNLGSTSFAWQQELWSRSVGAFLTSSEAGWGTGRPRIGIDPLWSRLN